MIYPGMNAAELDALFFGDFLARWDFWRSERRATRLKRRCDCGHAIDGGEPYRYQVGKMHGARGLFQRLDCEFCARANDRY